MAVTIPIISEFDGKGVSRAIEEFKSLETVGQKAQFALKKAAIPAAAAIGGLAVALGGATKAAMEDQAAQVQLAGVLERSASATQQDIAATEEFISSLSRATAVADDDLRPALAQLVQATGSLEQSQQLLVQAQDISASTGKDLATVTDALSKAYNGNMKGLRALDASLIPLISDGLTFTEVMDVLAYTTGGAAADAAQTAEGRMRNLSIQIGEAKESIGAALLPVIAQLIDKLIPLAEWVQQNTQVVVILAGVIGGLSAAVLAINAAMKVYQATLVVVKVAQAALNFVMSANPIGVVILAIAALVAAFVILEKKFGVVSSAVEFLGEQFYKWIINPLKQIIDLAGRAASAVGAIAGGIGGAISAVIPGLAEGGIVTSPTLAMIGEGGEPEAVIPLSQLDRYGGGGGINITINSTVADDRLGDVIVNALRQYNRRSGPINVAVA
jgi:SLT domain-containing protein